MITHPSGAKNLHRTSAKQDILEPALPRRSSRLSPHKGPSSSQPRCVYKYAANKNPLLAEKVQQQTEDQPFLKLQ